MAQVEKFGSQASRSQASSEALRDLAWREMVSGGVWAAIGAAIVSFATRPPGHDVLYVLAAPPLLYGVVRFFHGLARWMRV
ncbi:MAG: hypothetical protein ABIU54_07700 [Candidatus Eisenbacteria bacterium]